MKYLITTFLTLCFVASLAQAQKPTIGIKNFRQYIASLEVATGIQAASTPSIVKFYNENRTRLPKNGVVTEINGPTLLTYTALAGLFCQEHAKKMVASHKSPIALTEGAPQSHINELSEQNKIQVINGYAQLFLDRDATPNETKNLLALSQTLGSSPNIKLVISACASFGASIEFIAGE